MAATNAEVIAAMESELRLLLPFAAVDSSTAGHAHCINSFDGQDFINKVAKIGVWTSDAFVESFRVGEPSFNGCTVYFTLGRGDDAAIAMIPRVTVSVFRSFPSAEIVHTGVKWDGSWLTQTGADFRQHVEAQSPFKPMAMKIEPCGNCVRILYAYKIPPIDCNSTTVAPKTKPTLREELDAQLEITFPDLLNEVKEEVVKQLRSDWIGPTYIKVVSIEQMMKGRKGNHHHAVGTMAVLSAALNKEPYFTGFNFKRSEYSDWDFAITVSKEV